AAPLMPPAPPTFSMITCWPSSSDKRGASTRAMVSVAPPAPNGTTMVTGRVRHVCAAAGAVGARMAANSGAVRAAMAADVVRRVMRPPLGSVGLRGGRGRVNLPAVPGIGRLGGTLWPYYNTGGPYNAANTREDYSCSKLHIGWPGFRSHRRWPAGPPP